MSDKRIFGHLWAAVAGFNVHCAIAESGWGAATCWTMVGFCLYRSAECLAAWAKQP